MVAANYLVVHSKGNWSDRPGLKPIFKIQLLAFLALHPLLRAQESGEPPVVTEEKIVVEGSPREATGTGDGEQVATGIQPVADQGWGAVSAGAPNLQVESAGGSSFGSVFSLRGLSNTPYFSDPAVAVYFDDIPLGSSFTYPTDLFGFASASVFPGPTGTVFGHAGDGGVIELRLPDPGATESGELLLEKGNFNENSGAVQAAGAVGRDSDATVAASYTHLDGQIENTQIHQRVGDERALTAIARARYRPSPTSEISVELLGGRHRDGAQPLVPLGGPLDTVQRAREGETDTDMMGAAIKAALGTPAGRLTAVTSFTDWRLAPYEDWLVIPPPLDSHLTQSQETWSEEMHLDSNPGPGPGWSLGAWLSDSKTIGATERSLFGVIPIEGSDYESEGGDAALFGEARVAPARGWEASLGLRLEYAAKDYHQDEQVPTSGLHFHFRDSSGFLLPKFVLTHGVAPGTTAEASVSLGARPGGFSPYTDKPALIPYAAEHTAAFETGVTSASAHKAASLSARVFAYAVRNYQIEQSFSATDYLVATAPRARSLGAEVEAKASPLPGWTLDAVGGVTDATLISFNDPVTGKSYAGNRAPYAPAYTGDLGIGYGAARGFFARADLVAKGKTFYSESEAPLFAQGSYALVNARAGYETRRWRLTVFLDNITGTNYYAQIIPGVNSGAPGSRRTLGSELAVKF